MKRPIRKPTIRTMAVTKIDQRAKETSGSIFNLVERIYEKISRIPASFAEALDKVLPEQQFQIQRSGAGACQSVPVQIAIIVDYTSLYAFLPLPT